MHVVFSLETGGLENGVVNLCNRLNRDWFAPSVCVFRRGGELESRVDADGVELLKTDRHGNMDPTLPFRLAWHLWSRRIDILHTHSWGTLVEGVLAAKLARTPVVVHGEHGVLEERPRNVVVQHCLWSKVDQLAAVADTLADRMAHVVGIARDRIQVVTNGVDTERFRPLPAEQSECRRQFGLPATGLLIGTVARLDPVKNHVGILHALARLTEHGIDVHLALAGNGPLHDEIQRIAGDLQIAERVYLLGNVTQVERFLAGLDVLVLNSHSEGMSNTVLEAMSCGLPVVATSVGSNPVLVDDSRTGCLVPPGDVAALTREIERLAMNPSLRHSMGKAGRLRIESDYSIDRMVRDYQDLYLRTARVIRPSRIAPHPANGSWLPPSNRTEEVV
jgi:sugar transferase (PEP-CTERM/EpsH1 system associated)